MATISQINEFIIANGGEEKIVDITIDGLYLIRAIGGDGGGHRDKQTAPSGMHPGGGTGSEVLTYVYLRAGDSVTQMGGQSGKGRGWKDVLIKKDFVKHIYQTSNWRFQKDHCFLSFIIPTASLTRWTRV